MPRHYTDADFNHQKKATQLSTLAEMKAYNAILGEVITTNGYYVSGDKGGGKYIVVNTGTADEGLIVALNNGLKAQLIHDGAIYARQYGVKLDDVTDDSDRLNAFFLKFGTAKLVVNDGIARTTKPLIVKGKWREDTPVTAHNNSGRKLIFDHSTIRYDGTPDKCIIMFWRHYSSFIEGLSIDRTSVKGYVDQTMNWHTEFKNFDIPELCINRDISVIPDFVQGNDTKSVHTMKYTRGYIHEGNLKLYSEGTYLNSIHFYDVNFFSNEKEYCVEIYGSGLMQNLTFNKCDLSYSTKAIFKIEKAVPVSSSIKLDSCYLDSAIPYTDDFQFKGFKLINKDVIEAASSAITKDFIYTKDYTYMYRQGGYGANPDSLPTMNLNLAKNGDLGCKNPLASPGWISNDANITYTWTTSDKSISGNVLIATFLNNATTYFYGGVTAPVSGSYSAGVRMKLVSGGVGTLQIGMGGLYKNVDLSKITAGEEFVMTSSGLGVTRNVGDALTFSFSLSSKGAENVVFEIYEIFIIPGVMTRLMLPLHPKAQVFRKNEGTITFSGDGAATSRNIPHGLYDTPKKFNVVPASADAGTAGVKYVTADATNLTLYYNSPPIIGTSNAIFKWWAEI